MPPGEFPKRSGYLPDVQKAIQLPRKGAADDCCFQQTVMPGL